MTSFRSVVTATCRAAAAGLVVVALAGVPAGADAQAGAAAQSLLAELRAGAAVGNFTETEAGLDLLPRPSFGALLEFRATESLAAYVGVNRSSFGCEEGFCQDRDVSVTSEGVMVGGRWAPGLPWARAGVGVQRVDVRATGGEERSDLGLGVELAGGVEFGVGDLFRVRPGLTYLRHDASNAQRDAHVALLALEIGVAVPIATF